MSENNKMYMFEVMFGNIERKLKWLAIVTLILGIVGSVIVLLVFATYEEGDYFITGLIIGAAWIPVSLITSWLIYAFADLVENTKAINTKLNSCNIKGVGKKL